MGDLRKGHKAFDAMKDRWALCRAAAEGEHAIHEAREAYLPRLTDESDNSYALRLRMTPWFNATWRTISGMRGMLFSKPPTVEFPASLTDLLDDIDLAGTTMLGLAQEVSEEALTVGRIGLLVDYPEAPEGVTLADAKKLSLRPLISTYKANSIYNWRETRTNGVTQLTQVRLIEKTEVVGETEFEVKEEEQYRILDLLEGKYRQRLFRVNAEGEEVQVGGDIFPTMGNAPMGFIPFVVIGVDCVGMPVETPPLIDLVTTNLHHYLQATSYERGCFFSGLPTMFISGMEDSDKDISIGGSTANALGSPNAKAYYVEVASKFEALRTNLEDKKREMAVLGARMLEGQKAQTEAAETLARRQSGEESVLSSMAQTISQGLTRALEWVALWAGSTEEVSYELNRDFLPSSMTSQDLTALVSAWQSGAISQQTLFENLKQGEIIAPDVGFDEEQERINGALAQFAAGQEALPLEQLTPGGAQPAADTSALEAAIAALTELRQMMVDQVLQAIAASKSEPVQSTLEAVIAQPDTGMQDMMKVISDQHVEAMAAMTAALAVPAAAPIVNVEAQPAPVINIAPAAVNVAAPVINMPEQPLTINMPEQPITISVPEQHVTVQPAAPATPETRVIRIKKNSDGSMTAVSETNQKETP